LHTAACKGKFCLEDIDSTKSIAGQVVQQARTSTTSHLAIGMALAPALTTERWYGRYSGDWTGSGKWTLASALFVTIAGPGAMPEVTSVVTGQYRWQLIAQAFGRSPAMLRKPCARSRVLGPATCAQVSILGTCRSSGHRDCSPDVEGPGHAHAR